MESRQELHDVIVVGAGIEGSSTAYQLAKKGKNVLLIEQFPLPHSRGSSHGQTRITRKAYGDQEFYTEMMGESFSLLAELETESGETFFKNCGCLVVGTDDFPRATASALKRHNIPHEILDVSERKRRYPTVIVPDNFMCVLDKSGGVLRAEKILLAYHKRFKELGGVIRDGEPMMDVMTGDVVTVRTNKGEYKSRSVVLAIGPWAAKFLPKLGLNIPLKPVRISVFYWKERSPGEFSQFPTYIETGDSHVYGLPSFTYPGLVKICHHAGPVIDPDYRDHVESSWVTDKMKSYVARRFPTLEPEPSVVESCIYTNTPDGNFVLDTHPRWKNLVIGAGFSGHGFKLAPVVGKVLAELALGQKPSYDLTHFKMDRFKGNKL